MAASPRKGGVFYGWYIVGVAFLASFVGAASSGYGFGVMIRPMSEVLGWSRADLVLAQTLGGVTQGLSGPYMGRLVDRYGARWMMTAAGLASGLLLVLLPVFPNKWYYWIAVGGLMGFTRAGMFGVVSATAVANWFIRRHGRALAISGLGVSASGILMTQVMQWVVTNYDWGTAWAMLGVLMWVGMALPAAILVRRRPEDLGLLPDGAAQPIASATPGAASTAAVQEFNWEYREAVRTRPYWMIAFTFITSGVVLGGMLVNMAPYLQDIGMSGPVAAAGLSMLAVGTFIGRFTSGFAVERIPLRWLQLLACLLAIVGILALMALRSPLPVMLAILVLGMGFGTSASLELQAYPAYFGRKASGQIRGLSEIFRTPAQFGGPLLAAWLFDQTHTYQVAFGIFIAMDVLAALAIVFAGPPRRPTVPAPLTRAYTRQRSNGRTSEG